MLNMDGADGPLTNETENQMADVTAQIEATRAAIAGAVNSPMVDAKGVVAEMEWWAAYWLKARFAPVATRAAMRREIAKSKRMFLLLELRLAHVEGDILKFTTEADMYDTAI